MKDFFRQILKDKNGDYNLRELATMIFIVVVIISWISEQFFGFHIPEHMFYGFIGLVGAGCFGYSIEGRRTTFKNPFKQQRENEK